GRILNCSVIPESCKFSSMQDIICADVPEAIYISPVGCQGILRRKKERKLSINPRLEEILFSIASRMAAEEIEKKSRVQRRGKYSNQTSEV
ncbi:MAG: restriction endonuclease subunit M, partial [Lachnospiraceae bacterium]|nr:restriction endonuclease subunit M [Lachnospiraceae bacterium]